MVRRRDLRVLEIHGYSDGGLGLGSRGRCLSRVLVVIAGKVG
jgi:hypothetical protein